MNVGSVASFYGDMRFSIRTIWRG